MLKIFFKLMLIEFSDKFITYHLIYKNLELKYITNFILYTVY